jgi:hypothetical protein
LRSCKSCDIEKCGVCEVILSKQSPKIPYTSCKNCDTGYALTKEYMSSLAFPQGDRNMPR